MNEAPQLIVAPNWALSFLLLVCLTLGTLVGIVCRGRLRLDQRLAPRFTYLRELSWLAAPVVVVATFAGLSTFDDIASGRDAMTAKSVMAFPRGRSQVVINGEIPVPTDDRTVAVSNSALAQRPSWVDQPPTSDGVSERVVLASQQYTTQEEAEQEVLAEASELLLRDLQKLRPGIERPKNWNPSGEEIKQFMVKQKYVEAVDRDFGTFFHPMYRVWWQVDLSPQVRTEFLPQWRRGLTVDRIRRIGIVASSLVLAASLLAIYRRLDVLTQGTRRIALMLTGVASIAAWGFLLRFASERWF